MESHYKLQIYQSIIKFLLETTNYSLKSIALLSKTSITDIRSIHNRNQLPPAFDAELKLVQLFQIILEINATEEKRSRG